MKKLTIFDLATILQLSEEVKEDLKNNFDSWDDGLKYEIQKTLWDGVHELKDRLAKLKYEELLLEVDYEKRPLRADLYSEAVKLVWKDFDKIISGNNKILEKIEPANIKLNLPPV